MQRDEATQTSADGFIPRTLKRIHSSLPFQAQSISDGRYDNFITEKIESYPRGYPRLSAFLNADIEGRIYRRFGKSRTRLLLHLQDQIVCLETELDKLDREHSDSQPYRLCSRRYDEEETQPSARKDLLAKLGLVLAEYDGLLLREHQIMSIREPSAKAHRFYFDYIWNQKPLCKEEYQFIYHRNDFVELGVRHDMWLGPFIETFESILPNWLLRWMFTSKEERAKSDDPDLQFHSNARTHKVVKAIIGIASTLLLVLPVVILYLLTIHHASPGVKIAVLLIFVVAFAIAISTMTRATRHEMFAASAA